MGYLILSIVSSTLIGIIMRLGAGRVRHGLGMLAVSYLVCTVLAGSFFGFRLTDAGPGLGMTAAMGGVNGILYLGGFILMQHNTRCSGVVLTSIFQKLGLLVTLAVSVILYREIPNGFQLLGAVLAVSAILLMNGGGAETGSFRITLLWMLGCCGMADAMSKIFAESGVPALEPQFLFLTFGSAMVLCFLCMWAKGQSVGGKELLYGTLIAIPNFFCSKFLLGALERLSAIVVYPVYSVGCILAVTLAGICVFRERLEKRQWIGIAVILVALVLLNL